MFRGVVMLLTCMIWPEKLRRKIRRHFSFGGDCYARIHSERRFSYQEKHCQNLIMTLLVRDEVSLIEDNLKFHLAQGVDKIIVTDNNSIDGTKEILDKYSRLGVVEIIHEPSNDYDQARWVDRMIRVAIEKYDADWIINADADEFFLSKTRNLKDALPVDIQPNILLCWWNWGWVEEGQNWREVVKFSKPPKNNHKSIHSARFYRKVGPGNHKVHMSRVYAPSVSNDIDLYHIQLNDFEKFRRRMEVAYLMWPNFGHKDKKYREGYRETVLPPRDEAMQNYQKIIKAKYSDARNETIYSEEFSDFMKKIQSFRVDDLATNS